MWVRPQSKRKEKFKNNSQKGISLGFVPHTTQNCLGYNCNTGKIGKASHVRFDEGMNDLLSNLIPPKQHDLEHVEKCIKFPVEANEDNVDK